MPQKPLLKKGPSFVPTPSDVNWLRLQKDFEKFITQLRYRLKLNQQSSTFRSELQQWHSSNDAQALEPNTNTQDQFQPPAPPKRVDYNTPMYCSKKTYNKSLEMFIKKVEKELFDPENGKNVR